ncbi:MAG: ferredoxin--NADP reductase [Gammaproteobacteria bacterium]
MPLITFTMTLEWIETIAPQIRHFAFRLNDDQTFTWIPGQFVNIHFESGDRTLRRSYSIASIPGQNKLVEFAASYIENGPASQYLWALQPGDEVTTSGPFGRLILRDESPQRYILAATSTGVTPYHSMLNQLAQRLEQTDLSVTLLFGVRRREDLLYEEDFVEFAKQHSNFSFCAHYSQEKLTELSDVKDYEYSGHVQTGLQHLKPDPQTDIIYLCGNPKMIDDSFEQLKSLGFDVKNVRREKYVSTNAIVKSKS